MFTHTCQVESMNSSPHNCYLDSGHNLRNRIDISLLMLSFFVTTIGSESNNANIFENHKQNTTTIYWVRMARLLLMDIQDPILYLGGNVNLFMARYGLSVLPALLSENCIEIILSPCTIYTWVCLKDF